MNGDYIPGVLTKAFVTMILFADSKVDIYERINYTFLDAI